MPTHKVSGEPIVVIQGIDATTGLPTDINVINNAASVYESNWSSQQWPKYQQLPFTGAAGAADNAVLYTSGDVLNFDYHVIQNTSAVAIDVHVTLGTTFNASQPAASVILYDDVTTGGGIRTITIPANSMAVLDRKCRQFRIDQAAAGTISAGAVVGYSLVK